MKIAVVTPWLNAHELIPGYLEAIQTADPDEVRVIDNGSDPPLAPLLPGCQVFRMDGNLGFSAACNLGLKLTRCEAVVFLNNDIKPTGGNWLQPFRELLRPGLLVGAALVRSPHGAVDGRGVPYLDGWCIGGMKSDLMRLGGFDEGFEEPAYYSDNDLSVRARAAGMRLVQAPVGLRHLGNYTTRRLRVDGVSARNYERYAARVRELAAAA